MSNHLISQVLPMDHSTVHTITDPHLSYSTSDHSSKQSIDPDRFDSILIHNVTHSDLLLSVAVYDQPNSGPSKDMPIEHELIAQPKFHLYDSITRVVYQAINQSKSQSDPIDGSYFPSMSYNQFFQSNTQRTNQKLTQSVLPYGFRLKHPIPVAVDSHSSDEANSQPNHQAEHSIKLSGLRFRSGSRFAAEPGPLSNNQSNNQPLVTQSTKIFITGVYFPLLSVIIPKFLSVCQTRRTARIRSKQAREQSTSSTSDQSNSLQSNHLSDSQTITQSINQSTDSITIYFVSGAGEPWDSTLDRETNSTHHTAEMARMFISRFYSSVNQSNRQIDNSVPSLPSINQTIKSVAINSPTDLFHYDANVLFVNTELKPRIESHRRELANQFYEDWPNHLSVYISITDAASARINAVNAAMRSFQPDCLHMWQMKSFWRSYPLINGINERDVEWHEFEKLEMTPPVLVSDCADSIQQLVAELVAFKESFETARDGPHYNELSSFWLRKSKKPVLCVLQVARAGRVSYYRGLNTEMSMPTGSLCSERCAIAQAVSHDPLLTRKDFKMIAVLALPIDKRPDNQSSNQSDRQHDKEREQQLKDEIQQIELRTSPTFRPIKRARLSSSNSMENWSLSDSSNNQSINHSDKHSDQSNNQSNNQTNNKSEPFSPLTDPCSSITHLNQLLEKQRALEDELVNMKVRRAHATGDDQGRNPIAPCGACSEWLKKIAEVMPDFKVITFTSTVCDTVFVKAVNR